MSWTDERVERLKKLWAQDNPPLSASEIAEILGDISRNGVIGKVHRMGLPGRPSPIKSDPSLPRSRYRKDPRRAAFAAQREASLSLTPLFTTPHEVVNESPMPIGMKSSKRCQFIRGEPDHTENCKCPRKATHGPYCAKHDAVVWLRKPKRRAA